MYLLKRIDVWARNRLNRVVKTSKLQFIDSGLLAALLDVNMEEVQQDRTRFGNVLETFALVSCSSTRPQRMATTA